MQKGFRERIGFCRPVSRPACVTVMTTSTVDITITTFIAITTTITSPSNVMIEISIAISATNPAQNPPEEKRRATILGRSLLFSDGGGRPNPKP